MKTVFFKIEKGFTRPPNSRNFVGNSLLGITKKKPNLVGGFTLIETLVSIAIFAAAITGLMSITASGVANTNFVKNKFTAGYLALEGAELIHNMRDTASISGTDWNTMLGPGGVLNVCTNVDDACRVDPWTNSDPILCPSGDCPYMTYQKSTGKFSYNGVDNSDYVYSIFKRKISIRNISPTEIRVTSSVEWMQGVRPHSVSYSYNLLDWTNQ
jgi:prepilin-type N-terminal cleavage/methylation domain-containing protein